MAMRGRSQSDWNERTCGVGVNLIEMSYEN